MRYIGVVGFPLGQSISPFFQQAALDYYGLEIRYERWETRPEQLAGFIARLREEDRMGANVTVPHKQAVLALMDHLDETAREIGAVNTIAKGPHPIPLPEGEGIVPPQPTLLPGGQGMLVGYNTDCTGFLAALRQEGGFEPRGKRALVLGAGGAARAVVYALATAGAEFIGIAARRAEQARALRTSLQGVAKGTRVFVEEWGSESLALALPTYDLIVNTTPVGMRHGRNERESPLGGLDISPESFVYDLVYNPRETPLLKQARQAGCASLDGLPMLVYQGAAGFQLWTGREAPVAVMRAAAEAAMAGQVRNEV